MPIKWKKYDLKKPNANHSDEMKIVLIFFVFSSLIEMLRKKRIFFYPYSSNFELMRLLSSEYFLNWCESGYDLFIMETVDCICVE